jgi:hypothetical protein
MLRLLTIIAVFVLMALPARSECYLDYKAKQDNPLRLQYGVAQVSEDLCGKAKAARADLEPRLMADGWKLIKIVGFFGPEGLDERKESAGAYFLRY